MDHFITGITGGIGAGKSVVSRILRLQGHPVYDCDYEAKRMMECDAEVVALLREALGDAIYTPDGRLDRGAMAEKIFSDLQARLKVNGIVHEAVRKDFLEWAGMHDCNVFIESAILSTSGLDKYCSAIWLVDATVEERVSRVMARNGLSAEEVMRRIESQKGEFELLPMSKTIVIDNGGDVPLLGQIYKLLNS